MNTRPVFERQCPCGVTFQTRRASRTLCGECKTSAALRREDGGVPPWLRGLPLNWEKVSLLRRLSTGRRKRCGTLDLAREFDMPYGAAHDALFGDGWKRWRDGTPPEGEWKQPPQPRQKNRRAHWDERRAPRADRVKEPPALYIVNGGKAA